VQHLGLATLPPGANLMSSGPQAVSTEEYLRGQDAHAHVIEDPDHLARLQRGDVVIGSLVRIQGLSGRADLNNKEGLVVAWEEAKGRFAVEVWTPTEAEATEAVLIKPANLVLAGNSPAGSTWREKCVSAFGLQLLPEEWAEDAELVALSESDNEVWSRYYQYRIRVQEANKHNGRSLLQWNTTQLQEQIQKLGLGVWRMKTHTFMALADVDRNSAEYLRQATMHSMMGGSDEDEIGAGVEEYSGWIFSPFMLPHAMELRLSHTCRQSGR